MEINVKIDKTKLILGIVVAVLVITVGILTYTIFSPKGKPSTEYELKMAAYDTAIKYKDILIEEKRLRLMEKDSAISKAWDIIHYKDSLLEINNTNEKKHIKSYNQVPATVRNLDKDALRRAVREFQNNP